MIKCHKCVCKNQAVYECLTEETLIYSCPSHVVNETTSMLIEYNAYHSLQIESLKNLIKSKQRVLTLYSKLLEKSRTSFKPSTKVRSFHKSNQFLMAAFISMRQIAGQKQDRNQAHILKFAIKSLQKYPIPIIHPEQAFFLQGIGPSFLKKLHDLFRTNHVFYKNLKNSEHAGKKKSSSKTPGFETGSIKLYVDTREIKGNIIKDYIQSCGINYELKTLSLGDYIFVAENLESKKVLDLIIERKSSSDLNSSHFSNHLRDQIRRLKNCEIPHKFLLIEGKINYEILIEMWIVHKIRIMAVSSQKKTFRLMRTFQDYYEANLRKNSEVKASGEFESFQEKNGIRDTVGEIFYRQMLEFPGMTPKKLNLFVSLYPTLIDLLRSYKESSSLVHQSIMWCGIGASLELSIYSFFGIKS